MGYEVYADGVEKVLREFIFLEWMDGLLKIASAGSSCPLPNCQLRGSSGSDR